jgi:[ribosomal protein S5]-alanine N-acetyltransferase
MQIPTLETRRLILEPPSVSGWPAYERFYTDAAASWMYGGPVSVSQAWARLASDVGTWHLQGFGVWLVRRKDCNEVVGTCGFWQGKGWPRELTWWLTPQARGQGLAKEASVAAIAHGYGAFGWAAVNTFMKDDNEAARALVRSLGGTKVDRMVFPDHLERDVYLLPRPLPAA